MKLQKNALRFLRILGSETNTNLRERQHLMAHHELYKEAYCRNLCANAERAAVFNQYRY